MYEMSIRFRPFITILTFIILSQIRFVYSTYSTPVLVENPCKGKRVRIIIVGSNCFESSSEKWYMKNKLWETVMPFIKSLSRDVITVEHYVIRFCINIDKAKKVDYMNIVSEFVDVPFWVRWGKQKKAFQTAMIEANMLVAEKAQYDKEPFEVIFISAMLVDYQVKHELTVQPYLEHTYSHRLFFMKSGFVEDGGKPIAYHTGIPLEFITQIDTQQTYVTVLDNANLCGGKKYGEECNGPLECANNLACISQTCGCPQPGMISTPDQKFCRSNTYENCNHKWNCHEGMNCELTICRASMPSIVCPQDCTETKSCPEGMVCNENNICSYIADKIWYNWIYNKSVTSNEILMHQYSIQYYWLILSGTMLLLTLIGIPSIIAYRIKKNTIVPAEVIQRITQIPETIAIRASKIARSTRETFSKAHFPKFSRFENWPSRDSEDQ